MAPDQTSVVATVGSRVEAELIAGMLRSEGVRSAVFADDAGGWEPQLQQTQGVRVIVADKDTAKARRIIDKANRSTT
ncbi:MAG: putative signal transducing protein [Actinomycetes bacterium]